MSHISIIKNIQLGVHSFPVENPDSELHFNFYCGNGAIKHEAIISFRDSYSLSSLIETGDLTNNALAQNNVDKLQNLEDQDRAFQYRYQIGNFKECNNEYLIIFDINEYRDYYGCFIYAVLQIERNY